eukprot:1217922-Karenia_brevis.AAC.1
MHCTTLGVQMYSLAKLTIMLMHSIFYCKLSEATLKDTCPYFVPGLLLKDKALLASLYSYFLWIYSPSLLTALIIPCLVKATTGA